jgi:hypothetical protein
MTFALVGVAATVGVALDELESVDHLVVLSDGVPVSLLSGPVLDGDPETQLAELALPPVVIVPATIPLAEFIASQAVTLLDVDDDLAGLVVVDDDRVVAVIPIDEVDEFLAAGGHRPEPTEMGPVGPANIGALAGDPRTPLARVRCAAKDCGAVNVLAYFDRSAPPDCVNPDLPRHSLALREVS